MLSDNGVDGTRDSNPETANVALASRWDAFRVGQKTTAQIYFMIVLVHLLAACVEVAGSRGGGFRFPAITSPLPIAMLREALVTLRWSKATIAYDSAGVPEEYALLMGVLLEPVGYRRPESASSVRLV